MKKEHFRADKDGNLDRSKDKRGRDPINKYEKEFQKKFEDSGKFFN